MTLLSAIVAVGVGIIIGNLGTDLVKKVLLLACGE